jgi:hypothetical protein
MSSKRTAAKPQEGQKKVAIVGFAESWKLAPWDDPSIECWCLNEFWKYAPRWNRWFELHDDDTLGISKRDALPEGEQKRHLDWLSKDHGEGKPIYMQPQYCDGRYPNAVPLPLDRLVGQFGRYFTSSIGYMTALAIADGYDWIGLYGIDLASDIEYQQQRANAEYFVGYAKGQGRTVVLAETSAICKAGHLYGYEKPLTEGNEILEAVKAHKAGLVKKHEETLALMNTLDGAIQESDNFIKLHEYKERGVTMKTY